MASKTPISILQEHCVSQNLPMPRYDFENRTPVCSPSVFACYCFCDGKKLEAVSSSKKDAKQRVAEMMLRELGVSVVLPLPIKRENQTYVECSRRVEESGVRSTTTAATTNYVGLLNEYCSGNKLPYPDYGEARFGCDTFFIECRHGGLASNGEGRNKKDAKQDAARKMLELINKNGPSETKYVPKPAYSKPNYDIHQVIDKYKNLSINPGIKKPAYSFKGAMNQAEDDYFKSPHLSTPDITVDVPKLNSSPKPPRASNASLVELKTKLKGRGIAYEVEKTQDSPIVLIYSEKSSSKVSLEIGQHGDDYETVLCTLLGKVVQEYEILES